MSANRRTLLLGFASAPAVAALPALANASPDAALLELDRQRLTAKGAYERLASRADALWDRAMALAPPKPEALKVRRGDWFATIGGRDVGQPFTGEAVAKWRRALEDGSYRLRLSPRLAAEFEARGREVLEAHANHVDALEAVIVGVGFRHADALAEAASRVFYDLERQIFATSATTPEGWRIKARIAAEILGPEADGTYEDELVRSLLADVLGPGVAA